MTPPKKNTDAPVIVLNNIEKSFGSNRAVKGISFSINPGEVVGLIGENGAGKSTLLKILTGMYQPDSGSIEVNGKAVKFRSPRDSVAAGIGVVHQEQSLFTNLTVAENIAMNSGKGSSASTKFGIYRWSSIFKQAAVTLDAIGSKLDPRTVVNKLSFVDRQMVEIARAVSADAGADGSSLVILDEPTSVLERHETEVLEKEIRKLKKFGAVIFVSHRLDEIMRNCERILVMRDGELVADRKSSEVTEKQLFKLMIGHDSRAVASTRKALNSAETPAIEIKSLSRKGKFSDVSFSVHAGRLTAIVGATGSGREELARALFGAEKIDSGIVTLAGKAIKNWRIPKAVKSGIGYVPSERKVEGIIGGFTASENLTLTHPGKAAVGPFLIPKARKKVAQDWFDALDVRPNEISQELGRFSGGNQQKVVMAKWLNSPDLRVLILDHPLRGLDPGAAETVNAQIKRACKEGAAVILLADTLEEALEMGDEVLVMRDGEVTSSYDLAKQNPSTLDLLERMV